MKNKKLIKKSIENACQSLINKTRYGQELNGINDITNDEARIQIATDFIMSTLELINTWKGGDYK